MEGGKTIDDLSEEQRERLAALIARLSTFPGDQLIVRCLEAIGVDGKVQADLDRIDAVMAGAWAYDRVLLYLDRLRTLNEERMQLGSEIHRLVQIPGPTTEAEIAEVARARVMAPHLAGKLELVLNFFTISVQHIRSLLMVAAEAVDYPIPADDLVYLDEFRFLRNHFEHWYSRLPGKDAEGGLVTKTLTDNEYRITGGLQSDDKNRVIVIEPKRTGPVTHVVDVTNDGVARIERIVQETLEKVVELALMQVREHFIADPSDIPPPESVRNTPLIRAGGRPVLNPTKNPAGKGGARSIVIDHDCYLLVDAFTCLLCGAALTAFVSVSSFAASGVFWTASFSCVMG